MDKVLDTREREQIIRQLRRISRLLDTSVRVPGTKMTFGLDPILGLLPGVGDSVSLAISAYIILQARRLGYSKATISRMLANIGIDALVGTVPLVGNVFDFAFKANVKNLRLMGITPSRDEPPAP